ncbi:DUF4303 domain-containing protein [Mycolicibacterium neworleansense]|uniref:DUF4303 domain-containing protein n=1 Tax=Mycolicibacterium neworleansense TaxID=146018 RepID=A0A0H5RMF6_9MYCO|nr:DUF4303 domain-containing protein [Mycolicibacterium neworleansense]CRZ14946.1 hypothetical protein BN2156_01803 [Mycolicibacterium neworleansense]
MALEWDAFETELTVAAANAVRAMVEAAGSETPYAVAFSEFYAETTGVIYLPNLALATEESVEDPDCRFSPPDWEYQDYEWGETDSRWGERLSTAVTGLPRARWEQEWGRFAQAMLNIAAGIRTLLVADGTLPGDAVVYLDDEDADLLVRSLTADELRRHFPDYLAAAEAERDVLAMPVQERVGALAAAAGLTAGPDNGLGRERATQLLLDTGAAAVPAGLAALGHRETAWAGAKLLADLNIATPEVLDALWAALPLRGNAGPPPLDYTLLAAGLADPAVAAIVGEDLKPGRGYCTLDAADLPGVRPGLEHAEPLIRRHAVIVLSDLVGPMGPGDLDHDVVSALEDQIDRLAADDPDSEVRRLAGYRART